MAKILIVDDRASNREYLTTLLAYAGHTLLEAADGARALESVRNEKPELVITDILMPTMDGFEFVQRLRKDPQLAATRVIFHTATYSEPQAHALARSCGVDTVLPKPSEPREVLDAVNLALGIDKPVGVPPAAPKPRSPDIRAREVIDDTLDLYTADLRTSTSGKQSPAERKAAIRHRQAKALSEQASENIDHLQRVRSRLSALIEVGMEMDRERNPARLVEIFFGAACEIVQSDFAAIAILDERQTGPRHVFAKGIDAALYQDAGRARHGLLGTLLDKPRAIRASGDDGSLSALSLPDEHPPTGTFLGMAIATESQTYGWIYFANRPGRKRGFGVEDERIGAIMSAKLALLYDNLQLYDLVQRHAADLQIEMAGRERAEQEVREATASYRAVFENSVVGIFIVDPSGRVTSANPALARILGYDSVEKMLVGISNVAGQVYVEKGARGRFYELLRHQRVVEGFETKWRRNDGTVVWVSLSARAVDGPAIGHIGMAEDITQRKRSEEELRRFRLALDNSADMVLIIDRTTMRMVDVNDTACRLLGYTREELLRMGPQDTLPVSRQELEKRYDELIANPSLPSGMESYYRCKDGSHLPFESTRHVLRSGDNWLIAAISRDIRERLAKERALRESEAGLRRAQVMAKLGHVITGPDGAFQTWSDTLPELVGLAADQFPRTTRDWLELLHPEDRPLFRAKAIEGGQTGQRTKVKYRLRRADGSWIHIRQTMDPLRGEREAGPRWFNTIQDLTEQREAEEKIERLNRVYAVLSGINTLIVRVHDRDELFREACRIAIEAGGFRVAWLGALDRKTLQLRPVAWHGFGSEHASTFNINVAETSRERDTLAAQAIRDARPAISNDVERDARILLKSEMLAEGLRSVIVLPLIVSNEVVGTLTLVAAEPEFFDEEEVRLLTELVGDIAFAIDHIEKKEKLDYLAFYDELTGLANRTLFQEHLAQFLHAAEREQHKLALLIFDVERFKSINDTLGRQAGDALLKQLAERMTKAKGDQTRVARLSADHFALVLPRVRSDEELARRIENRMQEFFDAPFKLGDTEIRVAAKIGIALFPQDGADGETLFKNAEAALKKAKSAGERYVFYTQEMTKRVAEKLTLENKLRRALDNDEFVLHYQPKVELEKRAIVGVEALIRWQSPELGLVPPVKFIPLMEETGLILQVGAWALKRAALDHKAWVEAGLRAPRVAVNVSPIQLRQRDFVKVLQQAIFEGASPAGIDLEITESLIMEDIHVNIEKLLDVRKLGLSVAIDDFGTGYSSLAYLARLPVETLKIDRSFVITMLEDPNTATLVQTMITLAHSFRLKVVAEGVDSEEQAKMLRLLRCDQMQGYLFSKPVPQDQLLILLSKSA